MKPGLWLGCSLALLAALAGTRDSNAAAPPSVVVLRIDGAIGPATAQHVSRSLEKAAQGAAASAAPGHDAMAAKRVNDAAAYIRSLAQLRSG